jgi:hypothetical protein
MSMHFINQFFICDDLFFIFWHNFDVFFESTIFIFHVRQA